MAEQPVAEIVSGVLDEVVFLAGVELPSRQVLDRLLDRLTDTGSFTVAVQAAAAILASELRILDDPAATPDQVFDWARISLGVSPAGLRSWVEMLIELGSASGAAAGERLEELVVHMRAIAEADPGGSSLGALLVTGVLAAAGVRRERLRRNADTDSGDPARS